MIQYGFQGKTMSYQMAKRIQQARNVRAVSNARKAGVSSVEDAMAILDHYSDLYRADRSDKNQKLRVWAESVVIGARIIGENDETND